MNLYFLGILAALVVFFAVGIGAGRMVKDTNDYYVSGRNAPTLLIVGSLIASFLSTGAFLGDTGEVYSGFFIGIVTVGVIQATGYIYGAGFFGRYIRRSEVTTLPEYFGRRFCSAHLRRLSAVILLVSVSAYLLSAIQGVATLMSSITGYDYRLCAVIVWLAFTVFTIYSGSPGVLLTDTIMFLVFLAAALVAEDHGGPRLRTLVLMWPVTDAGYDWDSYVKYGRQRFLTAPLMKWMFGKYVSDPAQRGNDLMSPVRASAERLRGLPATLIVVAENDILRDEGEAMGRRLDEAGVEVTTVRFNGVVHDWGMLNGFAALHPTRTLIRLVGSVLRDYLEK